MALQLAMLNPPRAKSRKKGSKRKLSAYNKFVSANLTRMGSMAAVAKAWKKKKSGGSSRRSSVSSRSTNSKRKRSTTVERKKRKTYALSRAHRKKISEALKGHKVSATTRKRISVSSRAAPNGRRRPLSDQHKKKISKALKARYRATKKTRRNPHYRRNPVVPGIRYNPVVPGINYNPGAMGMGEVFSYIKRPFTDISYLTQEILPAGAGFVGTAVLAGYSKKWFKITPKDLGIDFVSHAVNLASAGAIGGVTGLVSGKWDLAEEAMKGGLVYAIFNIIKDVIGEDTWGDLKEGDLFASKDELTSDTKDAIAGAIQEQMYGGVGDYANIQDIAAGPRYSGSSTHGLADYATATGLTRGNLHAGRVGADLLEEELSGM